MELNELLPGRSCLADFALRADLAMPHSVKASREGRAGLWRQADQLNSTLPTHTPRREEQTSLAIRSAQTQPFADRRRTGGPRQLDFDGASLKRRTPDFTLGLQRTNEWRHGFECAG